MPIRIIVTGAGGRMGPIIAGAAQADPECELAAVVARSGRAAGLGQRLGCAHGDGLEDVLPHEPGAVVIDFTAPEATVATARAAAAHGNPMVSGTTGLSADQLELLARAAETAPLLWAPNMSVGVNTLLKVLPRLVELLGPAYDLEMVELHHRHKKDAPSGTALKIAQVLAEARDRDLDEVGRYCRQGIIGARPRDEIGVQTIRGGDVVGVHTVYCLGPGERIEVTHQAHSRENFARGALRAAKWLADKPAGPVYAFADALGG